MAQNREKDETLDIKVPSETKQLSLSCPDNYNKIPSLSTRVDPDPARPRSEYPDGQSQRQSQGEDKDLEQGVETASLEEIQVKKSVKRCSCCGKRVGLTGFRCRCGDLFCGKHRYSDRHDCSYDYKAAGREAIARENPVVRASKILKV